VPTAPHGSPAATFPQVERTQGIVHDEGDPPPGGDESITSGSVGAVNRPGASPASSTRTIATRSNSQLAREYDLTGDPLVQWKGPERQDWVEVTRGATTTADIDCPID
jgi:hypothetical protein